MQDAVTGFERARIEGGRGAVRAHPERHQSLAIEQTDQLREAQRPDDIVCNIDALGLTPGGLIEGLWCGWLITWRAKFPKAGTGIRRCSIP
jgi:hypothetical protein